MAYTISKIAALRIGGEIISEVVSMFPELAVIPVMPNDGNTYEARVRTVNPTARFHLANAGVEDTEAEWINKLFQCQNLSSQCKIAAAVVANLPDPMDLFRDDALARMEGVLRTLATQIWQGEGADALGFPGIITQHSTDTDHNVDAGGTNDFSSVWFCQLRGSGGLSLIENSNSKLQMAPDWGNGKETLQDSNGLSYQGWYNWITAAFGLKLTSKNKVVRIKQLASDTGKGLTDDLLIKANRKCLDLGMTPDVIFGNSRSGEQLMLSRTSVNVNGLAIEKLNEWPDSWRGIPIIWTPQIPLNETT